MKRYVSLLILSALLASCNNPGGRSWIIPVTIDPSDLVPTPEKLEVFETRRESVLSGMEEGYVILKSSDQHSFNRNAFRPNNYFFYLTGYDAPRAYAVLSKGDDAPFILAMPPRHIELQIYEGERLSDEQVQQLYRPDRLLSYFAFRTYLDSILQTGAPVYMDRSDALFYNELQQRMGPEAGEIRNIARLVDEMRVIKGPLETEMLQKACNITARALINVLRGCAPGMYEFEMESIIEGTFLQYGAAMPGFGSIVGSGPNSTILHYDENRRKMEAGDLLLMDIGAEYGYYTADITRTIPVSGRFSGEQRNLYQIVLEGQKAAIDSMKPGKLFTDGHDAAMRVITGGLIKLGLITDSTAEWQADFYTLHGFSHYLGMDVHDVGNYRGTEREGRVLEPGMVLTIEPGLYIREQGLDQVYGMYGNRADSTEIADFIEKVRPVYEAYAGNGIRIEDDILITAEGNINLSRYAPKEIGDIEQLMR